MKSASSGLLDCFVSGDHMLLIDILPYMHYLPLIPDISLCAMMDTCPRMGWRCNGREGEIGLLEPVTLV
jgi:hypothetical protein